MSVVRLILSKIAAELDNVSAHVRIPFVAKSLTQAMVVRPVRLQIETTNVCNANCVFCWYQYQERPTGVMAQTLYDKALADFALIGGGSLDLTPSAGDPLVDPGIIGRIRAARRIPAIGDLSLYTNMILADRRGIADLVRSGLTRLTVSVPGFDEETYQRVYRSPHYRRMLANVLALLEENRGAGNPLDIRLGLRSDRPLAELVACPDMQRVIEMLGWHKVEVIYRFKNWGGRITGTDLLPGMRLKSHSRWRHPRLGPCIQPYVGAMVFWDGAVGACSCVDGDARALIVGNLHQNSLKEIWQGDPLRDFRASFGRESEPQTCRSCNDYTNLSQILRRHFRAERERLMAAPTSAGQCRNWQK